MPCHWPVFFHFTGQLFQTILTFLCLQLLTLSRHPKLLVHSKEKQRPQNSTCKLITICPSFPLVPENDTQSWSRGIRAPPPARSYSLGSAFPAALPPWVMNTLGSSRPNYILTRLSAVRFPALEPGFTRVGSPRSAFTPLPFLPLLPPAQSPAPPLKHFSACQQLPKGQTRGCSPVLICFWTSLLHWSVRHFLEPPVHLAF